MPAISQSRSLVQASCAPRSSTFSPSEAARHKPRAGNESLSADGELQHHAAANLQPSFDFWCALFRRPLLLSLFEISQIRRRLVFADWHQQAVTAHEITFLADGNHRVAHVFGTADFAPAETRIGVAHIL